MIGSGPQFNCEPLQGKIVPDLASEVPGRTPFLRAASGHTAVANPVPRGTPSAQCLGALTPSPLPGSSHSVQCLGNSLRKRSASETPFAYIVSGTQFTNLVPGACP